MGDQVVAGAGPVEKRQIEPLQRLELHRQVAQTGRLIPDCGVERAQSGQARGRSSSCAAQAKGSVEMAQ